VLDLVVRGGTVLDGTGREGFEADVVIAGGRIAEIGTVGPLDAPELDAAGLFVAPGFIDIHSHSDYTLLLDPRAVSAIHQGVTLEVIGNCGHGCFPVTDPNRARNAIYGYDEALPLTWSHAAEYFDRLEEARPAVNVLSLVPNGQLRLGVVGLQDRAATAEELAEMTVRLERALEEGAWGYSTGLEYATEAGVPEEEIEALCAPVARHDALYATHTRFRDEGAADAVEEAVRTAERAGVRLQVSHLVPRNGPDESRRCMAVVDAARERGLDVAFDMHTRLFGFTYLSAALPAWAIDEGPDRLAGWLRDADARERMTSHRSILSAGGDWTRVVLLDNELWPDYGRRDLASIAAERGQEPMDTVYDLLLADVDGLHRQMVMIHCYTEAQQREAFGHPLCMPGSDATTLAPDGPLADSVFHGAYTWAAWFYRAMVRETGLLTPAEAVNRLTALPAERLGLRNRGVLRAGAHADLAIFNPEAFGERGTTFEPNQLAVGMRHVVVNGVVTLDAGEPTGNRGGEVLRRSGVH
jgi:N-acyl-D-aspartate/D-glutamate deacylase